MASRSARVSVGARQLDARPDTLDFRDRMYEATLVEVPPRVALDTYRKWDVPILDQGKEGACTGFGLATVANYLLRRRRVGADTTSVSPRMFYEMAKRYDEWPGERYEGSSARGAMKGWHKHGVCSQDAWPYDTKNAGVLTNVRAKDAILRPLGAYYRVNHKDLVCLHSAMAEVGILYATAAVHAGWDAVTPSNPVIRFTKEQLGGHAFALVGYDEQGFWLQNSWGRGWGKGGYALITYDDWLANGTDVWVARLGVPIHLRTAAATATVRSAQAGDSESPAFHELRPHIVSIGNNGSFRESGTYGSSNAQVQTIFRDDFPRLTQSWKKKRLLLYAHGGLVSETSAIQRVADYRSAMLEAELYPLAFIWKTDFWTTVTNILKDALSRRRPEGVLDQTKDFMLNRLDDALEPLARTLGGKMLWDEMKENAIAATTDRDGGYRVVLTELARLLEKDPSIELHVVGHSAGSIFHAPAVQYLTTTGTMKNGGMKGLKGLGLKIASCELWAPACTMELFNETYLPAVKSRAIGRFGLFTLTDGAEQADNCGNIYHKSLLYLVSNAFEEDPRIPLFRDGVPLLGMEKFVLQKEASALQALIKSSRIAWVRSPNAAVEVEDRSGATHHGDFDDDRPTLLATLARIVKKDPTEMGDGKFQIHRSASSLRDRRMQLMGA